jgi:catechol 2,3-dioxygenase-like lactoylglutathione lyase family enzyme
VTERRIVVDHVLFVVSDLDASRRLYTAALAPLGIVELHVQADGVHYGADGSDDFAIYEGDPPTSASHVAFDAPGRAEVDAFFEAALANGARERGAPAVWIHYSDRYYAAFVSDLHDNNVEAVFHSPQPLTEVAPIRRGVP